jgi:DNA-binding transcriptional ArsR family regulator
MSYGTVLAALADPTRRELYVSLRRGDRTVGELAALSEISQPATSQHLRVLRAADLVTERREGTRRYYRASTVGLEYLREFIESLWDDVLASYAADDPAPPKDVTAPNKNKKKTRRQQ